MVIYSFKYLGKMVVKNGDFAVIIILGVNKNLILRFNIKQILLSGVKKIIFFVILA